MSRRSEWGELSNWPRRWPFRRVIRMLGRAPVVVFASRSWPRVTVRDRVKESRAPANPHRPVASRLRARRACHRPRGSKAAYSPCSRRRRAKHASAVVVARGSVRRLTSAAGGGRDEARTRRGASPTGTSAQSNMKLARENRWCEGPRVPARVAVHRVIFMREFAYRKVVFT